MNTMDYPVIIINKQDEDVNSLRQILESKNFEIIIYPDFDAFLKSLQEHLCFLAFIDYSEVLATEEAFLSFKSNIDLNSHFIITTDLTTLERVRQFSQKSGYDYILKPFDEDEVSDVISNFKNLEKNKIIKIKDKTDPELKELTEILKFQKEALEKEQQRTRGIIEEAHIGILVLDGYSEEVFLLNKNGKIFLELPEKYDNSYFLKHFAELFPYRINEVIEELIKNIRKDFKTKNISSFKLNEERILSFVAYPIMMKEKMSSIVIAIDDITMRKNLEKQILHSSRLADIGELSAIVGHEINNPIAFITSNTNSLKKYITNIKKFLEKLDDVEDFLDNFEIDEKKILDIYQEVLSLNDIFKEKKKELKALKKSMNISKMVRNVEDIIKENLEGLDRVSKIVYDLKTLSYMGDENPEEINISELIESSLNIVFKKISYKAKIEKRYSNLPLVKCFSRQISQVFTNILINAEHAIKTKGKIIIKTYFQNNNICIDISDNGCGMSADITKKIFNPFFTTKGFGKGTGLGLSISYKIISRHNGDIKVESVVGKGTTFYITLPLNGLENKKEELLK